MKLKPDIFDRYVRVCVYVHISCIYCECVSHAFIDFFFFLIQIHFLLFVRHCLSLSMQSIEMECLQSAVLIEDITKALRQVHTLLASGADPNKRLG